MRILLGGRGGSGIIWPTSSHRRKFKIGGINSKDLLYKIMINCGFEKLQNLSNPALESPLSICLPSFPNPGPTPILHPRCQDSFFSVLTYALGIPYNIFDHKNFPSPTHLSTFLMSYILSKKIYKNTRSLVCIECCWPTAPEHEACPGSFNMLIVTLLEIKLIFFSPFSEAIN